MSRPTSGTSGPRPRGATPRRRTTLVLALVLGALGIAVGSTGPSEAAWTDPGTVATTVTAGEAEMVNPADACAGDGFTIFLSTEGTVLGAGSNPAGALGNGSREPTRNPLRAAVPAGTTITDVECGIDSVSAIDTTGAVWTWGGGAAPSPRTVALPTDAPAVATSSGGYFHVAQTSDGVLYSWGNNGSGRLGRSDMGDVGSTDVPGRVTALPAGFTVAGLAASRFSVVAWSTDGQVRAWGENYGRQNGTTLTFQGDDAHPVPTTVVSAATTAMATFVVDDAGTVWRAARGDVLTPWDPAAALDVVEVVTTFSAQYTVDVDNATFLVLRDGGLYGFGDNHSGQLGLDVATNYPEPVAVPLTSPPAVVAPGDEHTVITTTDSHYYVAGLNTSGQSGSGLTSTTPITSFTRTFLRFWPATAP